MRTEPGRSVGWYQPVSSLPQRRDTTHSMDVSSSTPDWSSSFPPDPIKTGVVKVEPTIDRPPPSPTTSLYTPVASATSAGTRQRSNTSVVPPRRLRPYPSNSRLATPDSSDMASIPAYHQPWSIRPRAEEDTSYFAFSDPLTPPTYLNNRTLDHRPHSSSSTLTNAMGDPHYPTQRHSPPRKGYTVPYQPEWQGTDHAPQSGSYVYPNTNNTNSPHLMQMSSAYSPPYSNPSSGSVSSPSPPFSVATFTPQDERYQAAGYSSTTPEVEAELRMLRKRVRELERINEHAMAQLKSLQSDVANDKTFSHPPSGPPAPSPSMQASWKARTAARIRIFCSLNRAGNALCAWHDSRRERRAHPPRMAPPGYLNCGCTFEEALFEESLARHNVGSYHPGESVRMDPALRNPLLKLMQARYGYKDGDFERDPVTGEWVEGEGHQLWELKAQSGAGATKRAQRGDANNDKVR